MPEPTANVSPVPGASRLSASVLAVLIVLAVLGSTLAVLAFTRDDGAPSPEAATRRLMDTIAAGDALSALGQLPPGERKTLVDSAGRVGSELQRIGLLTTDGGQPITDASIRFDNVELRATDLAKDMAKVELATGTMTVTLPPGAAPLTDHARKLLDRDAGADIAAAGGTWRRDFAAQPLDVVAIREGGGWHVSLAYSFAEAVRASQAVAFPEMGKGPAGTGDETPESSLVDLFRAYADGNPERMVTLLNPDEVRSLYDYAPLFLPGLWDASKAAEATKTYDIQLNHVTAAVDGSGSTRTVRVTSLDMDMRDELKKTHVTFDGRCLHADHRIGDTDQPFASLDRCDGEQQRSTDPDAFRDNPIVNLAIFGHGAQFPTLTVVERNGRWFISPVRSALDSIIATLQTMPADQPDAIDPFVDRLRAVVDAGAGAGLSGQPIAPSGPDATSDDPAVVAKAEAAALVEACGHLTTGADADTVTQACIARLVETQRITPADAP